jgi:hypothetical protein
MKRKTAGDAPWRTWFGALGAPESLSCEGIVHSSEPPMALQHFKLLTFSRKLVTELADAADAGQ